MALSQIQTSEFAERGFTVAKGFFDREAVDAMSAWLDRLRDEPSVDGGAAKYYERSRLAKANILVRIEHILGARNKDLAALLLPPRAEECLTQLLGEPPVLFKEKINYKLPGCRPDKLHQDQAAGWNAFCDTFVTMAIAVDENREDNAALSFMASGNYQHRLMSPEWQPLSEADPPYEPNDEYVLLEADPGDAIFFDAYVPHGSPANTGIRSRRNIFLTFNRRSDGDMRQRYYREKWASYAPNQGATARAEETFRV